MGKKSVNSEVCTSCGAETRPQALFCYNCGDNLSSGEISGENRETSNDISNQESLGVDEKDGDDRSSRELTGTDGTNDGALAEETSANDEYETGRKDSEDVRKNKVKVRTKIRRRPRKSKKRKIRRAKLRSATALRSNPNNLRRNKIEIVWEANDDAPNVLFLSITVGIVFVVTGLFFLAMYLK